MIFVKFTEVTGYEVYFVGSNLQAVLEDTDGGKEFGGVRLISPPTEISEKDMRAIAHGFTDNGRYIDLGIKSVSSGASHSYVIGWIKPN